MIGNDESCTFEFIGTNFEVAHNALTWQEKDIDPTTSGHYYPKVLCLLATGKRPIWSWPTFDATIVIIVKNATLW